MHLFPLLAFGERKGQGFFCCHYDFSSIPLPFFVGINFTHPLFPSCCFSGVKPVEKREGGGSHNWGTFEDEMKAEEDKNNVSTDGDNTENEKDKDKTEQVDQENAEPRVRKQTRYSYDTY